MSHTLYTFGWRCGTRLLLCSLLFTLITTHSSAQQDPMFTKYMFNSLTFNPAYAGSSGFLSANLLHREQWSSWGNRSGRGESGSLDNGAPITSLTIPNPMPT
ncbi:MAG: type IX secretion system membrane protein PorP/SprF, partial [Bacteroidota bacterium]